MAGIAVVAIAAMVGEMVVRRRKRRAQPKRRSNGPLPQQTPVFLGHDQRWTPRYSPETPPGSESQP